MIHQYGDHKVILFFSLLFCLQKGNVRMNQNKTKLLDCFKTGQGRSIESIGQNLVLASDTVTDLLDFFSLFYFFCLKFLFYVMEEGRAI